MTVEDRTLLLRPMFPPSSMGMDQFSLSSAAQAASRMYFNSQFFSPGGVMGGGMPGMMGAGVPGVAAVGAQHSALSQHAHQAAANSSMHSMNMLYMDSLQRQEPCSPSKRLEDTNSAQSKLPAQIKAILFCP